MNENRTDNSNYEPNFIMKDPDEGTAAGTDTAVNDAGASNTVPDSSTSSFNGTTYTGTYTDPRGNFRKSSGQYDGSRYGAYCSSTYGNGDFDSSAFGSSPDSASTGFGGFDSHHQNSSQPYGAPNDFENAGGCRSIWCVCRRLCILGQPERSRQSAQEAQESSEETVTPGHFHQTLAGMGHRALHGSFRRSGIRRRCGS